ncbi:MAG: hypothetical protein ABIU55_09690, partial [Ferruginibacter sp.]
MNFSRRYIYLLVIAAWLITLSFIIDNYFSAEINTTSVQKKLTSYVQDKQASISSLLKKKDVLNQLTSDSMRQGFMMELSQMPYYLYYFEYQPRGFRLKTWSTQSVIPGDNLLRTRIKEGTVRLPNGYYVYNKYNLAGGVIISLIPVKWNYIITNTYLHNQFVADDNLHLYYDIDSSASKADFTVAGISGKPLFSVKKVDEKLHPRNNIFSVLFRLTAALLVLLFIYFFATHLALTRRFLTAIGFLFIALMAIRVLSYYYPIPLNFRQFELFDPAVYGSSFILRSLGDLLMNALVFLCFVLFVKHWIGIKNIRLPEKDTRSRWIYLVAGSLTILWTTFSIGSIISSLVTDSQISFDVVNFFSLNIYSI